MKLMLSKLFCVIGQLFIDNDEPNSHVVNSTFVDRRKMSLSPNLKTGYRFGVTDNLGLFIEFKCDYLIKSINFYPLTYNAV